MNTSKEAAVTAKEHIRKYFEMGDEAHEGSGRLVPDDAAQNPAARRSFWARSVSG